MPYVWHGLVNGLIAQIKNYLTWDDLIKGMDGIAIFTMTNSN